MNFCPALKRGTGFRTLSGNFPRIQMEHHDLQEEVEYCWVRRYQISTKKWFLSIGKTYFKQAVILTKKLFPSVVKTAYFIQVALLCGAVTTKHI